MLTTFSGRNASQNEYELRSFITELRARNVHRYLEIGARHGDTFHEVMTSLPRGSIGVAVDFPGALWGINSSKRSLEKVVNDLNQRGYKTFALFGDSKSKETIDAVKRLGCLDRDGGEGSWHFDAALIDGDHTYDGVVADWENYAGCAPAIAFHDIVGADQFEKVTNRMVEVPKLWAQLKQQHAHIEFIANDSKMGIGLLWK